MSAPLATPASAAMPGGSTNASPDANAAANLLTGAGNLCTGIANVRNSTSYRWQITAAIQKDCKFTAGADANGKMSCVPATLPDFIKQFTEALAKYGISPLQLPMKVTGRETVSSVWFSHTKWKVVRPNMVAAAVYGGTRKREADAATRLQQERVAHPQDVAAQERAIGAGASGTAFVNLKMYQPISISYDLCQLDEDALDARCQLIAGELASKEQAERMEWAKKRQEVVKKALEDQVEVINKVAKVGKSARNRALLTAGDNRAHQKALDFFQQYLERTAEEGSRELAGRAISGNADFLRKLRKRQLPAVQQRVLTDYRGVSHMHNLTFSFPDSHGGRGRVYNPAGKTDLKLVVTVQGEHTHDPHFTVDVELAEAPLFRGSPRNSRATMILRADGNVGGTGKFPERFKNYLIKQ